MDHAIPEQIEHFSTDDLSAYHRPRLERLGRLRELTRFDVSVIIGSAGDIGGHHEAG